MHLPPSPYVRLNTLLAPDPESDNHSRTLMLHVGEPQRHVPDFVLNAILQRKEEFGMYPSLGGTPAFRNAVRNWTQRRYGFKKTETLGIMPTSGAREALFQIALCTKLIHQDKKPHPVVLIPEPAYHVYHGAAMMAGAKTYPLPLTESNNFTPDFSALPKEVLQNTVLAYLCTPHNPIGATMNAKQMEAAGDIAKQYNFQIVSDECYSEIYREKPPCGMLQIVKKRPDLLPFIWVVNSFSKRSSVPGLRVGFVISHPDLMNIFLGLRHYASAQTPSPLLHAATKLLEDEAHVEQTRAHYNHLFAVAREVFDDMGCKKYYSIPQGGIFLWLKIGDGETFAKDLWQHHSIKVMPGRYMCFPANDDGKPEPETPGDPYVRIAIVHEEEILRPAIEKIAHFLLKTFL